MRWLIIILLSVFVHAESLKEKTELLIISKKVKKYEKVFKLHAKIAGVKPEISKAIALTESSMNPKTKLKNKNGTEDFGFFQVNSSNLKDKKLMKKVQKVVGKKIRKKDLFSPKINAIVSAYILKEKIKNRKISLNTIARYHSKTKKHQKKWIKKMKKNLKKIKKIRS